MAASVVQSSTTSAISAEKPRASKKSASGNAGRAATPALKPAAGGARKRAAAPSAVVRARNPAAAELLLDALFEELARMAEMSFLERRLGERGFRAIAGTDEVGRGCLAGPVVAASVILDREPTLPGVDDSKQLSHADRLELCQSILRHSRAVAVGVVEPCTIDRINILRASKLAMHEAVENLPLRPDMLLLDAVVVESLDLPQVPLIHGDRRSVSIAAASIIAKVYRDMLMESYHAIYPVYDFRNNRGYGTESHWAALRTYGPSPIHRRSFEGVTEPMLLFGRNEHDGGPKR
jgi:ribonuclease HII